MIAGVDAWTNKTRRFYRCTPIILPPQTAWGGERLVPCTTDIVKNPAVTYIIQECVITESTTNDVTVCVTRLTAMHCCGCCCYLMVIGVMLQHSTKFGS